MRISLLITAAVGVGLSFAPAAQAQVYGGYPPPTAYASGGYDYSRGGHAGCGDGFTLAGARAGVTVLGLDIDAGAGLRVGTSVGCRTEGPPLPPPQPVYAPQYAPEPYAYAPPQYAEPQYAPQQYTPPPYVEAPGSYAPPPCGCEPMRYEEPSRYGW